MRFWRVWLALAVMFFPWYGAQAAPLAQSGVTYYVSSTDGLDTNAGTSAAAPWRTVARVNAQVLQPGDRVLFKCGDTWRAEVLQVWESGTAQAPITFGSYPTSQCANQPTLSGAQPITGWTALGGNVYQASPPQAINQLFRNGQRLGIARWPNRGTADGGYSTIDGYAGAQITDNELPPGNWAGARAHIKGMRWYILNREVTSVSGSTLTLNATPGCWSGNCTGWGFWLSNHALALDQDGEWVYEPANNRVLLFSLTDPNSATLEGSVVLADPSANSGGIVLGRHLQQHIQHVVVENLAVVGWFWHGISTPMNLEKDENAFITLRGNSIREVDGIGINLATWVWNAAANGNGYNGWRGGRNLTLENNLIEGANRMGINSYARQSLIQGNTVRNIARIEALNAAGMGCGLIDGEGACTEDGDGLRLKGDNDGAYSSNNMVVRYNTFENIGYNGVDVFGFDNTLEYNLLVRTCIAKGDCGAVRSFGNGDLNTTRVRNLTLRQNILVDTVGNTDGCLAAFDTLFGFGLYIDNYSRDVTSVGNVVAGSTASGILYQRSTGVVQDNLVFNSLMRQMHVATTPAALTALSGNVWVGVHADSGTLSVGSAPGQVGTANHNRYVHASRATHISAQGNRTLAGWQTYSGQEPQSTEWITAGVSTAELFYNASTAPLTVELLRPYVEVYGAPVTGGLTLLPYTGRVLIPTGPLEPRLSVTNRAPGWVAGGTPITYTLVAHNRAGATATSVVLTSAVPANASYLSGGTLVGGVVSWSVPSLAVGASFTATWSALPTGSAPVLSQHYRVSAAGGFAAVGAPTLTLIDPRQVYLPNVRR